MGDLRVPHFIGIHALQALPLLALGLFLLATVIPALRDAERRARLVIAGAIGYLGLFLISLWQALRGQVSREPR